jgi:predicted adenylyl cyclase CyaB
MPTNIEIKARVRDLEALKACAEKLTDKPVELLVQEDTFFATPQGRLKLRVQPDKSQLIYYEREDTLDPKPSAFQIYVTPEPEALKSVLAAAYGVRGVVRKKRWLYMVQNTRIHVDEVEGLGNFMELEVMLVNGETIEHGAVIAHDLMRKLGIEQDDLLAGAYMDLMQSG